MLKSEFPLDEILPVPKGVTGADIIQKVIDRSGRVCGQIVWESKKTKAWSDGWIQKLKDDQRLIKADIAIIVSTTLPENVKGFVFREGIWICDIKMAVPLVAAVGVPVPDVTLVHVSDGVPPGDKEVLLKSSLKTVVCPKTGAVINNNTTKRAPNTL